MFVDRVRIEARAGDGGDGCCSFRREKFVPRGGPDGGDGGKGGDIVLQVDTNVNNLTSFHYEPILRSKRGEHGMGSQCYGKAAPDIIFRVPVGTVVYRTSAPVRALQEWEMDGPVPEQIASELGEEMQPIADLTEPGSRFVLCKGGKGGRGNMRFKTPTNRAPRMREEGEEGETGFFFLELKTIADVGLVGFPNAGKSTLLGALSAAKPRVAPYPFTTLTPYVGVVELTGYKRFTLADIPGLIEGAHEGVGLGHDFLRHIERCKILLFVIDMAGSEGRDPCEDYVILRKELKAHRADLGRRASLICGNKMDLPGSQENLEIFQTRFRRHVLPICAAQGQGIEELRKALWRALQPAAKKAQTAEDTPT